MVCDKDQQAHCGLIHGKRLGGAVFVPLPERNKCTGFRGRNTSRSKPPQFTIDLHYPGFIVALLVLRPWAILDERVVAGNFEVPVEGCE